MASFKSENQKQLIATIFLAITLLSVAIQQRPCSATRDVFVDSMTTTPTTVQRQAAPAADYQIDIKYPWCRLCCSPFIGKFCCKGDGDDFHC
ncbi:unnamed protein product [Linum trigynum]|uniref:Transmembrane protein n=1 Tax=Linum trigynum TaxID=586398 RepID=A0AAV2GIF4_9ROSI